MVFPVIAFLPYILALVAGSLAVAFSGVLLAWVATPILRVLIVAGAAYLVYLALPNLFGKKQEEKQFALGMVFLGIALAYLGVSNAVLKSIVGG
jgi:uncharacterized membrane protein YwzB